MNKLLQIIILITATIVISGCAAMPPALIHTGYVKTAADVVSYATTEKSTTDHAISAVAEKDCALHRVITEEGSICYDAMVEDIMVAKETVVEEIDTAIDSMIDFVEPVIDFDAEIIAADTPIEEKTIARLSIPIPPKKPTPPKQIIAKIDDMDYVPDIKPEPIPEIVMDVKSEPVKNEGIFTIAMKYIKKLKNKVKNINYSSILN